MTGAATGASSDLELLGTRTLDGRTTELTYRPTLRTWGASSSGLGTTARISYCLAAATCSSVVPSQVSERLIAQVPA